MNTQNFGSSLEAQTRELKRYMTLRLAGQVARKTLRFINGNFRAQGYQGQPFKKWKANGRKGTILIKRGHLRRSFRQQVAPDAVRTWSESPYARVHNEGYSGTVAIPAHRRTRFKAQRVETGGLTKTGRPKKKTIHTVAGVSNVKAHTRRANIPRRQFMPTGAGDAQVLIRSIQREVSKELQRIFQ